MNDKRLELLVEVVKYIRKDPQFLVDIISLYQQGVRIDNGKLETKVNNLAYFGSHFVLKHRKEIEKEVNYFSRGLRTLKEFFHGSQLEKIIEEILNEN